MMRTHRHRAAFTLTEMLVVMAISGILAAAVIPSLSSIGKGGEMTKSVNDVAGLLELARAHAKSNNIKVDVGFRSDVDGIDAVVVTARDGESLSPISKIYHFPQVRLAAIPATAGRPAADFELATPPDNAITGFTFRGKNYPNVVQFNSRGEARARSDVLSRVIEIGLLANVKGQTPAGLQSNFGVVQITGLSGGVAVYRP